MSDLKSPMLIYLKGWLFLVILIVSTALLLLEAKDWKMAVLVLLIIWSAARFYYFMFYVIEKYVDDTYKFSGIISFVLYLMRRRK
ncbi:MAG: hypothetical protein ACI9SC_001536 [Gammaproteobacteria bacterium]